jgi:hypothetical protein
MGSSSKPNPAAPSGFSTQPPTPFSGDLSSPPPATATTSAFSATSPDTRAFRGIKRPKDHPSITYQVTLDVVCTGAQIEAVVTSLEGVGAAVSMKIEPRTSY